MKISTKGRYALRLMIDLGKNENGDYVSLKDISERQELSVKYLEQIISTLQKAGLLKSQRGPNGGYMLSKPPSHYTVGSILRITEGTLAPVSCLENNPNTCDRLHSCATIDFWTGLYNAINDYVDSITLADLIEKDLENSGIDFNI